MRIQYTGPKFFLKKKRDNLYRLPPIDKNYQLLFIYPFILYYCLMTSAGGNFREIFHRLLGIPKGDKIVYNFSLN